MLPEDTQANKNSYTQRTKDQNGMFFSTVALKGHTMEQCLQNSGGKLFPAWNCILRQMIKDREKNKDIFRQARSQKIYWPPSTFKKLLEGFPGGAVVENLPANTGDTGSSPGLGRSHMPRSN